jgi:hypothetical protein
VLVIFVLSLPHKMIGPELMSCCQLVYLSNVLYIEPSFLLSSVQNFRLVTGTWSLLTSSSDSKLLAPFSERVDLSKYFIKDSCIVVAILGVILVSLFLINTVASFLRGEEQRYPLREQAEKSYQKVNKILYCLLVFPTCVGFSYTLIIAGFFNSLRLAPLL